MEQEREVVEHVIDPDEDVTTYRRTGVPPRFAGRLQVRVALAPATFATAFLGTEARSIRLLGSDCFDGELTPASFRATTVNAYSTPGLAPETVQYCTISFVGVAAHVKVPSVLVASYRVIGVPPSSVGGIHDAVVIDPVDFSSTPVGGSGALTSTGWTPRAANCSLTSRFAQSTRAVDSIGR
jgi:hypothetical protein